MSVTSTSRAPKPTDAGPDDYAQMFGEYYPYIQSLVARAGIYPQDVEDVSMAILCKFLENDVLADYDPKHTTHHGGVTRMAVFRTFLSGFVLLYVRHYRERQWTRIRREPFSIDGFPTTNMKDDWASDLPESSILHDHSDGLYPVETILAIREHLASLPATPSITIPLPDLFEACIEQAAVLGETRTSLLMERFGVCGTTVRTRMRVLRAEIGKVLDL